MIDMILRQLHPTYAVVYQVLLAYACGYNLLLCTELACKLIVVTIVTELEFYSPILTCSSPNAVNSSVHPTRSL